MTNPSFGPPTHSTAEPCPCSSCGEGPKVPIHVYLFSGEFFESVEDLRIPGRGLDFVWVRKYRSRLGPETAQGSHWDFSYNIRIEASSDAQLKLFNGDAREDVFMKQPNGTFVRDEFFVVGSKNSDGTFTFTFPDNGIWNFFALDGRPEQGKISRIVDRDGNRLAFRYDSRGRLTEIIDTLDRQIRIAYNADSFIESLTDFTGRQVRYAYYRDGDDRGSAGDLRCVTRPAVVGTPNGNDFPNGKSTTYSYSKGFSDKQLNHKLLTITDSKGKTYLKNTYSRTKDPQKADFARFQRQVWGNDRDIIDIVYVPQVPERRNNHAVILAIVNDRNRNVKEYFYDAKDRCVLVREYTGRARRNSPTTLTANRPTRPLRDSDPEFFELRYEWNTDSLLTRILCAGGNVIEKDYEGDLDPNAEQRLRGNLRAVRFLPGQLGGDQPSIVHLFEYHPGFGCSCAENFVSKATDARGNIILRQFDDRGRLLRIQHRLASSVEEFEYNQFGQLIRQVHPDNGSGHRRVDSLNYYTEADGHQNGYLKELIIDADDLALTTTYEYDAVGNVTRITDPGGHDSLYVWNQLDQLVRELSAPLNDRGERYHVDFFYDANDNKIRVDVQNRDEEGRVQQNPFLTTTRDYDILNRCTRVTKESDPNHRVSVEFAYDGNGNRTMIRYGEATNGKQPANVLSIVYDERNLVFQRKRAPATKFQATTQYDYDRNRNLARILRGLEHAPREYRQTFDGFDRLISVTEPLGSTIRHRYDANGNLIFRQVSGGHTSDVSQSRIWFQANSQFDEMDRRVIDEIDYFDAETQPIGKGKAVTRTEYSDNSEVIRTIDDNGHQTRKVYDTANRERDIIDHKGNVTSYDYDRNSNLTLITVLEKSDTGKPDQKLITTRDYDNLDRPVKVIDNLGNTYRYGYDSRDNLTLSIDALGNATRFEYDGLKRLKSLTRFLTDSGTGGAPSGTIMTAQEWDDSSRLVSRTDPNGNVTRYSYDPLNREVSVEYADGSVLSHTHDVHGNRLTTKDPNGNVETTRYDLRNRPIHRSIKTGDRVSNRVTRETYEYDPLSRLTRAENDHSVVTRSYDSLSHIIREDLNGRAVKSVYDGVGNKLRCVYPSGREITFEYDELNRKTRIADDRGTIASYSYIGPSRVERRITLEPPSGDHTNYEYDDLKRLRRITRAAGDQDYSWDSMSNQTRRSDLRGSTTLLSREYRYDSAYRLSNSQTSDGTGQRMRDTVCALDAAGNRVSVKRGESSGRYTMSSADRPVNQYTTTPFDRRRYDKNGNLISIADSGGNTQEIIYDYRNLMATYTDKGRGIASSYLYDALGRRIATSAHGDRDQITHYFYDDLQNVEEQDGNGNTLATYVYGTSLNDLVNMRRASGDFYYHTDDLCSTVAITDRELRLVERYDYDDFGETSIFDSAGNAMRKSSVDNPYLFTGQRYDSETGFYYYRARFLDPRVGRFTTRDPIGMWEDAGNLGNAYTYARNNPPTFVDPKGESIIRPISCPGPWPGPRQVKIEYEGMSPTRRVGLDDPVCRAFRASGRSSSDVGTLWLSDFSGQSLPTKTGQSLAYIRQRVKFWFGGADNATSTYSKSVIMNYLDNVFDAFKENDVDIDYEGYCDGKIAYVKHGGQYDVNLCFRFFSTAFPYNFSNKKKAAILVHELTHAYSETDDKCYYPNDGSNLPWNLIFETVDLRENADTYEQFVLGDYT
jgi:RHS repeat-associated protein